MRLDPRKVRFIPPMFHIGLFGGAVRFVGRENTFHLQETALVVEGNLLKAGLLGLELLFRRALAEWSTVTIPYARITSVRYVRYPLIRIMALVVLVACAVLLAIACLANPLFAMVALIAAVIPGFLALYVFFRVPARYVLRFRDRGGRSTKLMFRITSKELRTQFGRQLADYRAGTAAHAAEPPTGLPSLQTFPARYRGRSADAVRTSDDIPDPLAPPRRPAGFRAVIAVAFLVITAGIAALLLSALPDAGLGSIPPDGSPPKMVGPPAITGAPAVGPTSRPGPAPKAAAKPPTELKVTAEVARAALLGRRIHYQYEWGKGWKTWRIDPGEIKELEVVATRAAITPEIKYVDVRVTLEGGNHVLRGVLTMSYWWLGNEWTLLSVEPRDAKP